MSRSGLSRSLVDLVVVPLALGLVLQVRDLAPKVGVRIPPLPMAYHSALLDNLEPLAWPAADRTRERAALIGLRMLGKPPADSSLCDLLLSATPAIALPWMARRKSKA